MVLMKLLLEGEMKLLVKFLLLKVREYWRMFLFWLCFLCDILVRRVFELVVFGFMYWGFVLFLC